MSTALDLLCFTVSFDIPYMHLLSVVMGVSGWGWERLESISLSVSTSFALWNNTPSPASAAEDNTFFMMDERTWIAPFDDGGGVWSLGSVDLLKSKKYLSALEYAFVQERYKALLWIWSIMLLDSYQTVAYGYTPT